MGRLPDRCCGHCRHWQEPKAGPFGRCLYTIPKLSEWAEAAIESATLVNSDNITKNRYGCTCLTFKKAGT